MAMMMQARAKRVATAKDASSIDAGEVARVAYELFQRRGGTHGCDRQDWFEAEQVVRQRREGKATSTRGARS